MRYQFDRLNADKYIDGNATGECRQAKLINSLSKIKLMLYEGLDGV